LNRQVGQELLGGKLLTRERHGIADQRLGKTDRCRHLDAGLCARPHDRNAAAENESRSIDQHKNREELRAQ
jgi:hypothetical protein